MKKLEKSIEDAVVKFAKSNGIEAIKLNGLGRRSLPDRMFLGPGGRKLFIEFKREGKVPTPLQANTHARWKKMGHTVHVVDDAVVGKALIVTKLLRPDLEQPLEDR